ncbi:hypothetical protein GGS23DRAFT_4824 [Durotheca rogersii]|uniref:uncharacterized protein n=1 Tax=Durotheca rogersii TaxID=419775 RepID=UPI00222000CC|nr:uncharacterized protein GGS23DRAFT_4824 [Durotheca rogersii]KAI5867959.1 hypothetical protein GGS23DRAFT_4824 [Durotheca rogersii]
MSAEEKGAVSVSDLEVDPRDLRFQEHARRIRLVDSARVGLTGLALLCGLTILGTSADTLAVYRATRLSTDFHLPLWPDRFDLRPTVALVVDSAIVVAVSVASLLFSKVKILRNLTPVHTPLSLAAPFVGFVSVMISMIFFYAVNASTTHDTLQSWSCQWGFVGMALKPHFKTLCDESRTALYLSVILVPVQLAALTVAGYQAILERRSTSIAPSHKSRSPTPS